MSNFQIVGYGRYLDDSESVHMCAKDDPGAFALYAEGSLPGLDDLDGVSIHEPQAKSSLSEEQKEAIELAADKLATESEWFPEGFSNP